MSLHIRGNVATIGDFAGHSLDTLRRRLVKREHDRIGARARRTKAAEARRLSVPLAGGFVMRPIRATVAVR